MVFVILGTLVFRCTRKCLFAGSAIKDETPVMGINTNTEKSKIEIRIEGTEEEDGKHVVLADTVIIKGKDRVVRNSRISVPKSSLVDVYSQRSSLGVYSIYGGKEHFYYQ